MGVILSGYRDYYNAQVLYVGGGASAPSPGDDEGTVYNDFINKGWNVTYKQDSASVTADADGKDCVFVSSTSGSSSVGNKFKNVACGVVVCEGFIWDDMDLVGGGLIQNVSGNTTLLNTKHPITDFLTGTISLGGGEIITANTNFGPDAFFLGYTNISTDIQIFTYEKGTTGANSFTIPGRRAGNGQNFQSGFVLLTASGRSVIINLMQWCMSIPLTGL